jgi:glycosyltransferase involved in cell wall biosynthesis
MQDGLNSLQTALGTTSDALFQGCGCSLVVPIYNDGYLAETFCREVECNVLPRLPGGNGEVIFVNDGSHDGSQQQLEAVATRYPWVTVIELSRNFGQHVAVSCGYRRASGRYVAMLNVDMQDPPGEIPKLIERLELENCDIALGLRQDRQDPPLAKLGSTVFNLLLNFLTHNHVPLNSASLRVMNRGFLNAFLEFNERSPFIPGLETWLGFRKVYVPIPHKPRALGRSSYTFRSRFRLAYNCILSFSDYPLKLMTVAGLGTTALGLLWGAYAVWVRLTNPGAQLGFASLLSAIVVFGGLNLSGIGIASLYIGRILLEVQDRPAYVIRSVIGRRDAQSCADTNQNRVANECIGVC